MEWNNWTVPELPWKVEGKKTPNLMKALSRAMLCANVALWFLETKLISPRDVLQWMSVCHAYCYSEWVFVCLFGFFLCGVSPYLWKVVFGHCVLSSWGCTRRCRFSSLQDLSMSCDRFADCFMHHSERSTKLQGSATKHFEQQRDFDSMSHEDHGHDPLWTSCMCFYVLSF